MREGVRKVLFTYLVKNIPYNSNKMITYGDAYYQIRTLIGNQEEAAAYKEVFTKFPMEVKGDDGFPHDQIATSLEEYLVSNHYSLFKTREDIVNWYADRFVLDEIDEAVKWLENEGYIKTQKRTVRFGTKLYMGITEKGWSIAHLYR